MLFLKRVLVGDNERVLVIRNGRYRSILTPGDYTLFVNPFSTLELERYNTRDLMFRSNWADFLATERRAVAEEYFTVVETGDSEVAVISADGKLFTVLPPGKRLLLWKGAAAVSFEVVDVNARPEVPRSRLGALERLGRESQVTFATVEDSKAGLLYIENRLVRTLDAGRYGFWTAAGAPRVDVVDLRRQSAEVAGQEILTKDKVSIRVNIIAEYQVVDPVAAKQRVKDYSEHLYRTLQMSVRETLGRKTLEEILADKTDVDARVAAEVRSEMATAGVRVGAIALKDIILPGDMREILNQVVSAEKQAQANLIRRREETAATRSLLNTAKLMEDNPILVRLKELETLERVVEKVDRVTVASGFDGLLENLVNLKTAG